MTKQAKHTPGPWRLEDGPEDGLWVADENHFVANCRQSYAMAEGESIANARLIAAAPEMAEALSDCKIFMRECLETEVQFYHDNPEMPTPQVEYFERDTRESYQKQFDKIDYVLKKAGVLAEGTGS